MQILYLHQYFNTPQDSGGTRSYEMARRLVAYGHHVDMITSQRAIQDDAGHGWLETEESGIHVHWLPVPYSNEMSYSQRIGAFFKFAIGAARKAASLKADVVFATSTPLTIALPGIYAARRQRIPFVFEVRDLWPELPIAVGALRNPVLKWAARWLEWMAYHASAHIVALSPGMAEGVMRRGIPASRVTVIPNSCDVAMFDVPQDRGKTIRQKLGLASEQPLIVYTGTFGLINGVGYLVRVAAVMRTIAPDVRFLLVGSGAELEKVTQQAHDLGVLGKNLWIWSSLPKIEIPDVLAAATIATSVFVPLKPMWNNSANKFFDALAARKPIAINYGGWQADLLQETGAGIVLPPDDIDQAARLLADFARDTAHLHKASLAARELAYTRFARDTLASQLEAVLRSVVDRARST
ncbi:MAG TPA: glycosyltransferase family 4 protein [Anaerolineae bacterium]|nr:glycosyltransferase family 4 protein [Anaerolineae bacterium]HQK12341.1 glycosyltransferase family 4 protein [Anaerolineae bacterium]